MQIIDAKNFPTGFQEKTAIALGMFDGVHLGHQKVISHAQDYASKHGLKTGVITLKTHPKELTHRNLKASTAPKLITNLETRLKVFESLGLDFVLMIDFDQNFMDLGAQEYLDLYLKEKLNVAFLSVGYDHHFGRNRSGNIELLKTWTQDNGIGLKIQEAFQVVDTIVSSSLIRKLLDEGDLAQVNKYLGYEFRYCANVVHGRKLGAELGFPTANLDIDPKVQLPANGVYKGFCRILDPRFKAQQFKCAINLGNRPSIDDELHKSLEVHIIDFTENIYDLELDLSFQERLRDEQKFANLEELKSQIKKDIEQCMN